MGRTVQLGRMFFLFSVASTTLEAQRRRGADTLSPAAVAESVSVLRALTEQVRLARKDGVAWHRLGMLAWVLAQRAESPGAPPGLDATRMRRLADTALRMAADLTPANVRYRLAVGAFLLTSGTPFTRTAAGVELDKAVTAARLHGSRAEVAEAALVAGRTHWWRYDALKDRSMTTSGVTVPRSVSDAMQPLARSASMAEEVARMQKASDAMRASGTMDAGGAMAAVNRMGSGEIDRLLAGMPPDLTYMDLPQTSFMAARGLLEVSTQRLPFDVAGEADFERARTLFKEAYNADPSFPGAFRAIAMVLADRGMWSNLESLSSEHVRTLPRDSLAWLALGLARHRQQKDGPARAAFDSALNTLGDAERSRLDAWRRVLPPRSTAQLLQGSDAERAARERLYWMMANPVWADSSHDTKTEFLARVAYAELRWTVEEFGLSGADSDRGDTYVRYGPPERTVGIGPNAAEGAADITTFWCYASGLIFAFRGLPTFATARIAYGDGSLVERLRQAQPVRWDNVARPVIDTLPTQTVRFRAGADSVDVLIAALMAAPEVIKESRIVVGTVNRYFWLFTPGLVARFQSTSLVDTAGVYTWSKRIAPGSFLYRVEEYGETAKRVGVAFGPFDVGTSAFPLHGFGISDILIGTQSVTPTRPSVRRWQDAGVSPSGGSALAGGEITVLWEGYELGQRNRSAEYDIWVTLRRKQSKAGSITARLAGALLDVARLSSSDGQHVAYAFSRKVPHAAAIVDAITLDLGGTPAGTYVVTIELLDRVSGRSLTRSASLTIRG